MTSSTGGRAISARLGEENAKLKRGIADLSLDKVVLQDIVQKKL